MSPGAIKVCGLRSVADADACAEAGVTLAGLNFIGSSRRAIKAPRLRQIKRRLPPGCTPVVLYRDQDEDTVLIETEALGLRWVQLHGDEAPEACHGYRQRGLRVIKALGFDGSGEALRERARRYEGAVDALLIDAPRPGEGRPWPWAALADLGLPRPFLLAGGLAPGNVARAIEEARPDGVDVASGIELDGLPSREKIMQFAAEARPALARVGAHFTTRYR